jgi:hypothetical protein
MVNLGPGTLKIGPTASAIDMSCLVVGARIATDVSQDDAKTMLCGTQRPGKITYTHKLTASIETDTEDPDGIFYYSQEHAGEQVAFEFVPNTDVGATASGTLTIHPLDFGADEYGDPLDSDLEWPIIGQPTYVKPTP